MKTFVVAITLIAGIWASTLPESEKAFLKQVHETCQANHATHADETLLKHMDQHQDDLTVMTHMLCMAQGTHLMSQAGTFNMGVVKSKLSMVMHDHHLVETMMNKCAVQKDTPMKTAMEMWMCFMRNHVGYMHVL